MVIEDNKAYKKIEKFFKTALKYYGKQIGLNSNQTFTIEQIKSPEKEKVGEYSYTIQYGYPQSGCVSLDFKYSKESNMFTVDKICIYAPPVGKDIVIANFTPQTQIGAVNISANFGIDTGTQKHTDLAQIEANPNAMKMLDIATLDLNDAQILGECTVVVPEENETIPCCDCVPISNTKGKNI